MKIFLIFCTIVLSFAGSTMAQTDLLNVLWDPNTEPDIDRYRLQRAVNGSANFADVATVTHPTVQVNDSDVSPGNLYTYRVAAIDQSGNSSAFSTVVSAGLPKLDLSIGGIPNNQPFILEKVAFLSDPDDPIENLTIIIDQENNVVVTVQNSTIEISPSPAGYSGPASFRIRAEDSEGFFDIQTVNFTFQNITEIILNIPGISFDEDSSTELALDDHVTVTGTTPADLNWSFSGGANLNLAFDSQQRILTLTTIEANWFGQNNMTATATAPDQTSASTTFQVTVNTVNDPPIASIQELQISGDPDSNIIDLKQYAEDVDNIPSELNWEFTGFVNFNFEWVNQSANIVKIIPVEGAATETGIFRVSDAAGANDEAAVTLNYGITTEIIVSIPNLSFDEDSSTQLALDDHITVTGATPADLNWSFSGGPNLGLAFDPQQRILTLTTSEANWFGQNAVTATAAVPDQTSASTAFQVTVNPVNDPPVTSILQLQVFSNPDSNVFDLKQYAADVDNIPSELSWEFSGFSNFTFEWVNQSANIIKIIPAENAATESGIFRVSDVAGGQAEATVTLVLENNGGGVFEVNIPAVQFDEDEQLSLQLDDFVTVSGATPGAVGWSFVPGSNLQFAFDSNTRTLSIRAKAPNWFGNDQVTAIATLPGHPAQTETFIVTINPVNDAPQLVLQNFIINPQSNNQFDLKPFVSDVDHNVADLSWTFEGFNNFTITFIDTAQKIIEIFPGGNAPSETGKFRVTDPEGASASQDVTLEMVDNINHHYHLSILPGKKNGEIDVRITIDVKARVDFHYWLDDTQVSIESLRGLKTEHAFTLKKLLADTTYFFSAIVRDANNLLIATADSTFRTSASLQATREDARGIFVYPNPIKTSEGHREMIFSNLPETSKSVSLFALNGDQIFQEEFPALVSEQQRISLENTRAAMPSGMYIYMVKDENARVLKTGKIVVVR